MSNILRNQLINDLCCVLENHISYLSFRNNDLEY